MRKLYFSVPKEKYVYREEVFELSFLLSYLSMRFSDLESTLVRLLIVTMVYFGLNVSFEQRDLNFFNHVAANGNRDCSLQLSGLSNLTSSSAQYALN